MSVARCAQTNYEHTLTTHLDVVIGSLFRGRNLQERALWGARRAVIREDTGHGRIGGAWGKSVW